MGYRFVEVFTHMARLEWKFDLDHDWALDAVDPAS